MPELNVLLPNLMKRLPEFWKACGDTLLMEVWSGAIIFLFGLIFISHPSLKQFPEF